MQAAIGTLSCHIYLLCGDDDSKESGELYPHLSGLKRCSASLANALWQESGWSLEKDDDRKSGILVGAKSSGDVMLYSKLADRPFVLFSMERQRVVHIDTLVGFGEDSKQNREKSQAHAPPQAKALLIVGEKGDVVRINPTVASAAAPKAQLEEGVAFQKYLLPHSNLSCAISVSRIDGSCYLVYASSGNCYACEIVENLETKSAGGTVILRSWNVLSQDEHVTQVVMIKPCAKSSRLYFFRANGWITSIDSEFLISEGRGKENCQNPNELAERLYFRREAQHKAAQVLGMCLKEACKTLNLVLKQHNFATIKGAIEKLDSESMEVSLRDFSDEKRKVVSWIWELRPTERSHRLKRQLGICTQKAKTATVDGTERVFVIQFVGDKIFLYVKLTLIPRSLQEAVRDGKGILKDFTSCETLLLLDIVHLDSLDELGSKVQCHAAVPSHYNNSSVLATDRNTDKTKLLEILHQEVNTIVQAFRVIRERKVAELQGSLEESREHPPHSSHDYSDAALLSTLRSLQKDLGEMWYATRRLIV